jgi:cytochrome c5
VENEKVPSSFFLIVGGGFVILFFIITALMGGHHDASHAGDVIHAADGTVLSPIEARTLPVGKVAIADPNAPTPAAGETAAASGAADGETVYNSGCGVCHGAGVAGAPKLGDKDAWSARIAQGDDVLHDHAINGFMGVGMMPAKGGNASLSDDEVKAAVDYMVSSSK